MSFSGEWFVLDTKGLRTNSQEGSTHDVYVDLAPICANMSNAEFRAMFAKNQARAVALLEVRVSALTVWQPSKKARAFRWFGRNDEATRTILLTGLSKVLNVVKKMNERNVVRTGSDIDHATGCTPHPIGVSQEAAHVLRTGHVDAHDQHQRTLLHDARLERVCGFSRLDDHSRGEPLSRHHGNNRRKIHHHSAIAGLGTAKFE